MASPAVPQPRLILASGSPRRIELIKNLGLQFEVLPADIDEIVTPGLSPAQVVAELAQSKAERVLQILLERGEEHPGVILAADTIVVFDGEILGKPRDRADAIQMLSRLSGMTHEVYTGVYVIDAGPKKQTGSSIVDSAKVAFRPLSNVEISTYVDTKEPMDKAGSYALQGIGAFMIEHIEGSPTNIIGLPLVPTVALLRAAGIVIMGQS